jgi:hypothetical protein
MAPHDITQVEQALDRQATILAELSTELAAASSEIVASAGRVAA